MPNSYIPPHYTCDGDDKHPPLHITDVPPKTESLALIVEDPDAPTGTWIHWTMWNIDPNTSDISEGTTPEHTVEGVTSFGSRGYGGPCPPSGVHRYIFKLYALSTTLDLPETATKRELERAMEPHILETVELLGLYERKK